MGVLIAYSSSAHRNLDLLSTREVPGRTGASVRTSFLAVLPQQPCACSTYRRNAITSSGPGTRSARGNARRRTAWSRQTGAGCTYAPRPGSVPRGSGTHLPSTATVRNSSILAARSRHPTQVRSGHARARVRPDTAKSTSPHRPHPCGAKIERLLSYSERPAARIYSPRTGELPRGPARTPARRATRGPARCPGGCRSSSR